MKTLDKIYDPSAVEGRLYDWWEKSGFFHASADPARQPFTIVMPPPNITGQLHMGHALDNMMQDAIIRFKRMQGYAALWLPGTDHASIATEVKIIEQLASEGLAKKDLGREGFLARAWQWKEQYGGQIVRQLRRLGSSCDWARERFTMDEGCSQAVMEVFVRLHDKGLIYRGDRIINWCPQCRTALSDAEVQYEESHSQLWHIRYPLASGDGYLVVATTRPETMLGDVAVAVHPEDERYSRFIGQLLELPLCGRQIPIIADAYVEKEFGSGAVKITPAHDPNDFEVGQRHSLPVLRIMDDAGVINADGGRFEGLDRFAARKAIVQELEDQGLLDKTQAHDNSIGHCYRCQTLVEPIISKQWFVKMTPLAQPAIQAVRDGDTRFIPDRFAKIYYNWMENIRDWCISRQLWWGHRIPAYYCACGNMMVANTPPAACSACGGPLEQDPDVLDTWFSSALWPFSTLGWPNRTADYDYFFPTQTLVTGYDIIFFWVARMIFSSIEQTSQVPFAHVVIHGIVRDGEGRKMSKSLGNGVDPLEAIDRYGADALRFSLATGNSPGNDMRFYWEKIESARNFSNKIWNASRFVLMNLDAPIPALRACTLTLSDQWILHRLNALTGETTAHLEQYDLGMCAQKLYEFIWNELCDWYLELVKPRLYGGDETAKDTALAVLAAVLEQTLRLLHPFMPFITEEIWQALPHVGQSIMLADWPVEQPQWDFPLQAQQMEDAMEAIRAVRNLRAQMNVQPARRTRLLVEHGASLTGDVQQALLRLAYATHIQPLAQGEQAPRDAAVAITPLGQIYLPLAELLDIEAETNRLAKEIDMLEGEIARIEGKLNNPGFMQKAPPAVVAQEQAKLSDQSQSLAAAKERLATIEGMRAD